MTLLQWVTVPALLLYFLVASQGAFYLLGFGRALQQVQSETFIALRKITDPLVRGPLKCLYQSTLAALILLLVTALVEGRFVSGVFALIALLCHLADILLIFRRSEPLNDEINYVETFTQKRSIELQYDWLRFIFIRGYLAIGGFLALLLLIILNSLHFKHLYIF